MGWDVDTVAREERTGSALIEEVRPATWTVMDLGGEDEGSLVVGSEELRPGNGSARDWEEGDCGAVLDIVRREAVKLDGRRLKPVRF